MGVALLFRVALIPVEDLNPGRVLTALKTKTEGWVPTFCTGWPDSVFLKAYQEDYRLNSSRDNRNPTLFWDGKNFGLIRAMGFDSVSVWSFRHGDSPDIQLADGKLADMWGRIYVGDWYTGTGTLDLGASPETWPTLVPIQVSKFSAFERLVPQFLRQLYPIIALPGIFEKGWQGLGYLKFARAIHSCHEKLPLVFSRIAEYMEPTIRQLLSIGIKAFMFMDDAAYKGRTFIPVDRWHALIGTLYAPLIDIIHRAGGVAIIHSDGDIRPLMPEFISLGFDGIQGLELLAGVDIFELFKQISNKIVLLGGLDVSTTLSFGQPDEVYAIMDRLFQDLSARKLPFILSPSQGITSSVLPANIAAMIQHANQLNHQYFKNQ